MPSDPRGDYVDRIASWSGEVARADRTHAILSNVRLALAAAIALLAWQAFVSHRVPAVWPAAAVAAFLIAAAIHTRVIDRIERARRARQLYERGLARIDCAWAGSGPDGARFLDDHPFARDLDLFGAGSLYQLLDTARTEAGQETLGAWLRVGAGIEEVRARQDAVAELSRKIDFREDLAVLAAESRVGNTTTVHEWGRSPAEGFTRGHGWSFAAAGCVSAILVVLVFAERVPSSALLAWLLAQAALSGIWRRRVGRAVTRIDAASYDLGLMASLLARIEREPVACPKLVGIRASLVASPSNGSSSASSAPSASSLPSKRITSLRRSVTWLDHATINLWFRPIGAVLLVRSQAAVAIDRWHAAHGPAVEGWVRAVGEIEALAALATYAYEHPADPFPALVEAGPRFAATALGHPLIDDRVGVRNDVALGGDGPCALIVSGSNMSGKSTLLRAVGVNVVLALAGAPVRAASLTLSPLAIGATLRVEDSLQAGHSRFYAEILRIRAIVALARERPLVFLLDEILGGTNSYDRRIGAEAILRALVEAGAIGLMTTHDLALTELASPHGERVANVHFEDRIENGAMVFDYRMRPGVVERSNAVALMRAVGLDV